MQVRFRPLTLWPGERTPPSSRRSRWTFKASWSSTLDLLERELAMLGARDVVIEVGLREDQIRIDGWPRAGVTPTEPGVIVSFDSRYGPLRYATDTFGHHEANIRAIALGLEALRKVDRYGITKRGEQYTGWRALPSGIPLGPGAFATVEDAMEFLIEHGEWGDQRATVEDMLEAGPDVIRAYYREAAKRLHPDAGGATEEFQRLQAAWSMLKAAHKLAG